MKRTWTYDSANQIIPYTANQQTDYTTFFLALVDSFLAMPGVTVRGSSDGVTGAMDQVNRITTISDIVFDFTSINDGGAAAGPNNHSWIVFRFGGMADEESPTGPELLLDFNNWDLGAGGNIGVYDTIFWTWSFHGTFAGGSASVAPDAPDVPAASSQYQQMQWRPYANIGPNPQVLQFISTTDGAQFRAFQLSTGFGGGALMAGVLDNPSSSSFGPNNWIFYADWLTTILTDPTFKAAAGDPTNTRAWLKLASPVTDEYTVATQVLLSSKYGTFGDVDHAARTPVYRVIAELIGGAPTRLLHAGEYSDWFWVSFWPLGDIATTDTGDTFVAVGSLLVPWQGDFWLDDSGPYVGGTARSIYITSWGGLGLPVVSNVAPVPPLPVNPQDPIQFDITCVDGLGALGAGLALVIPMVSLNPFTLPEPAHNFTDFEPLYAAGSTRVAIANGFRYTLRRAGGWYAQPNLIVNAVGTGGGVLTG